MKSIPRVTRVAAAVTAPPSKSYSVRALLLAAMSASETTITNCLDAGYGSCSTRMQNAECRMVAVNFLHFAFCILHSAAPR